MSMGHVERGHGGASPLPKGSWDLLELPAAARGTPEAEGAHGCAGLWVQLAEPVPVVPAVLRGRPAWHLQRMHQGKE